MLLCVWLVGYLWPRGFIFRDIYFPLNRTTLLGFGDYSTQPRKGRLSGAKHERSDAATTSMVLYYTKLHYSRGRADERAIMVATMHKTRYNSGPEATSHGTRLAVQWMAIVVVVQGHKKAAGACF